MEKAFTDAGLIVGGNKAGQAREITHVLDKVGSASSAIEKLDPKTLPGRINLLFRGNPLHNRRKERIGTLFKLQDALSSADHHLEDLARYLKADLTGLSELGSGRPPDIQKEAFALEVGRLWQVLTGREPSWKPGSPFDDLLNAAWASGFEARVFEPNFGQDPEAAQQQGDETRIGLDEFRLCQSAFRRATPRRWAIPSFWSTEMRRQPTTGIESHPDRAHSTNDPTRFTPNMSYVDIGTLRSNPRNARTHSKKQIRQIAKSFKQFGFLNPILVDETGMVLAGHGRLEAARLLGSIKVPVVAIAHLSDAEKRAYVIADNKLAENAGWDREMLAIELGELAVMLPEIDLDIGITGFSTGELDSLLLDHADRRTRSGRHGRIPKKTVLSLRDVAIFGRCASRAVTACSAATRDPAATWRGSTTAPLLRWSSPTRPTMSASTDMSAGGARPSMPSSLRGHLQGLGRPTRSLPTRPNPAQYGTEHLVRTAA